MATVKRRLFTMLSALSLVLCLATAGLWIRSLWRIDVVAWFYSGEKSVEVATMRHCIRLSHNDAVAALMRLCATEVDQPAPRWLFVSVRIGVPFTFSMGPQSGIARALAQRGIGFSSVSGTVAVGPTPVANARDLWDFGWKSGPQTPLLPWAAAPPWSWEARMPLWPVVAVTAVLPAFRFRKAWRRHRRRKRGLCLTCGYDLRASSERCPECGTPIPADLVRRPVA